MSKHYTFDDTEHIARKAAGLIARRYYRFGTTYDDALSDIHEWMYTPRHHAKVNRWLASTPQQTTRVYRSYFEAAQKPAEKRKAEMLGYDVDDVEWYSASLVESLIPLAINADYDGSEAADRERKEDLNEKAARRSINHREGGNTMAQVMDIRRAISGLPGWVGESFLLYASTHPTYVAGVEAVTQYLGGDSPYIGRRRVLTNATAQAMTGADYSG